MVDRGEHPLYVYGGLGQRPATRWALPLGLAYALSLLALAIVTAIFGRLALQGRPCRYDFILMPRSPFRSCCGWHKCAFGQKNASSYSLDAILDYDRVTKNNADIVHACYSEALPIKWTCAATKPRCVPCGRVIFSGSIFSFCEAIVRAGNSTQIDSVVLIATGCFCGLRMHLKAANNSSQCTTCCMFQLVQKRV